MRSVRLPMGTAVLGIAIVGGTVALALAAQLLVRRTVPLAVLEAHHTVAGHMMALVGGMFGILLAFSVVVVWEQYDRAREGAAEEANAAADLHRLVHALPAPAGPQGDGAVRAYLQAVIDGEWRVLERRAESAQARGALDELWQVLTRFAPTDDRTRNLQLAALTQVEELADARRARILHAEQQLPGLVWAVLAVGAVLTVAYANFFGLRYRRSQAAMVASLAGIIALVLFVIWVLDHPYRGSGGVHVAHFRMVLERLPP